MIYFPIAAAGANIFGVFRVKNHDFTQKNRIFPILGGVRAWCAPLQDVQATNIPTICQALNRREI